MKDTLFTTIQAYHQKAALLDMKLRKINFSVSDDFLYYDAPLQASEWELINYLLEKAASQRSCMIQLQEDPIQGLNLDEMFQDCSPAHILESVYGPKFVYEWMLAVNQSNVSPQEFYEHLCFGPQEDASIFLLV
ncbi:hypothetical protein [Ectobacillus ponti]|uniref:Uncharacterized protein n=1 Tax=Ectobacillus ponti TaxID=2961894 RepID=A0AA42BQ39_9BACI|nr:hypothetical protein [Ectobacillus ponti]MCP8968034.1 hypothetical protein [Ectobacillus ponti]